MRKALFVILIILFFSSSILPVFAYDPRYLFTDQEKDTESGLYDLGSRIYNPNIGTFIQTDDYLTELILKGVKPNEPEFQRLLTNPQLLNERSYASNNPLKYVDPTGETPLIPLVFGVLSGIFLSDIKTVYAPTYNSTAPILKSRDVGDLVPGWNKIPELGRLGIGLIFGGVTNKMSFGKEIVNEIVDKFGTGSSKHLIKMYHGSANKFSEILENGFEKTGNLWLTDSAAAANAYQYKFGLSDNFGVKTIELSKKLLTNLIDAGHVVVKEVLDFRFPFAKEYEFDDFGRKVINSFLKKD